MDKATKNKTDYLMTRVETIQKRIGNILKECAKSNNETLLFWSGKESELKKEYEALKVVYGIIIKYIIEKEYWKKAKEQVERVNKLKSVDITIDADYKKRVIHTRMINNLFSSAYNTFSVAMDSSLKQRVNLLNDIQGAIIKVNRIKNDTE